MPEGIDLTSDWQADAGYHLPPLPGPGERNIALHVSRGAQRALQQEHPWLYADAIERQSHEGQPGDLAVVFDHRRRFLGVGLYDPTSPIRVRVLQHGQPATIDAAWFAQKIAAALARREPLHARALPSAEVQTTGYRLIHGENDGLPGLVLDRYGDTCVLKLYTTAWVAHLSHVLPALLEASAARRLVLRLSRTAADDEQFLHGMRAGQVLYGPPLEGPVTFLENGLRFAADVVSGQKTGFFFDHRHNRAQVETLAGGREVLNLFAYSGAFSLYAARGGARRVVSQDLSVPALAEAADNFARNSDHPLVAAGQHELLQGDAFEVLKTLRTADRQAPQTFDLIVVDPPSFASSKEEVPGALRAYKRLVRDALGLLRPGGTLVMASCTARVTPQQFYDTVFSSAAVAGRPLQEIARTGHALDHPVGFAQGEYLKCLFARS